MATGDETRVVALLHRVGHQPVELTVSVTAAVVTNACWTLQKTVNASLLRLRLALAAYYNYLLTPNYSVSSFYLFLLLFHESRGAQETVVLRILAEQTAAEGGTVPIQTATPSTAAAAEK